MKEPEIAGFENFIEKVNRTALFVIIVLIFKKDKHEKYVKILLKYIRTWLLVIPYLNCVE